MMLINLLSPKPNNPTTNVNQEWQYANSTLSGSIVQTQDSQDEFYNGEYSGSVIIATTGELNSDCDVFKNISTTAVNYAVRYYSEDDYNESDWLSGDNRPLNGFISIFRKTIGPRGSQGIKYIKIANIDGNGNNQEVLLDNLTNIMDENYFKIFKSKNNTDKD